MPLQFVILLTETKFELLFFKPHIGKFIWETLEFYLTNLTLKRFKQFLGVYHECELYRYRPAGVCFCDVFISPACTAKIFLTSDDYNSSWILRANHFDNIETVIGFVEQRFKRGCVTGHGGSS